jgi:hypothetical protein
MQEVKNDKESLESKINSILDYAESLGVKSEVFKTPENPLFEGVVLFEYKEKPKEKTVRVYRGINEIDKNIFSQTCYALRGIDLESEKGKEVKKAVEKLLEETTYENFLKYKELAYPLLDDFGKKYLDDFDKQSQKYILDGSSFAHFLHWETFNHNGTISMFLPSPYLSVSHSIYESCGYIRGGGVVLILDIPISNLHSNTGSSENTVDLEIKPEYIKGFMIKRVKTLGDYKNFREEDEVKKKSISNLSLKVNMNKNSDNFTEDEERAEKQKRQREIETRNESLKARDKIFLEEKLKKELLLSFKDFFQNIKLNALENVTYKECLQHVYDFYQNLLSKIGRNGINLNDFGFDNLDLDLEKLLKIKAFYENKRIRELGKKIFG